MWLRTPRREPTTFTIPGPGTSDDIPLEGNPEGLCLRWIARPAPRKLGYAADQLSVSLFLLNKREPPRSNQIRHRDPLTAFQVELSLHSAQGFPPRRDALVNATNQDNDEALANLQYRHDFCFASGHNVAVIPSGTTEDKPERTFTLTTTWLPTAEVQRVVPEPPDACQGIPMGMEALADLAGSERIIQTLQPIVKAYRHWIARQPAKQIEDPALNETSRNLLSQAQECADRIEAGIQLLGNPLVREASRTMNLVISLPQEAGGLARRVTELTDELEGIEAEGDIAAALKFNPRLRSAFAGVEPAALWQAIEAQRGGGSAEVPQPKDEELRLLIGPMDGVSSSAEDSTFEAAVWSAADAPVWFTKAIRRVLLVKRLREVQALVGFTRFTARTSSLGGLPIDTTKTNRRAQLANDLSWLPAAENRGEGIFIEFDPAAMAEWQASPAVQDRVAQFTKAFENDWLQSRGLDSEQFPFPGAPYILLHSLSHLLITEMALECGYGASSIRERIYANREIGYGILLLTSTSGSEGTLGGLVDAGRRIDAYLEKAFERAQLCSNDPFCSEHDPNHPYDIRPTDGAACHGCELIAETSCEQRNEFLDRTLVSRTVAVHDDTDDPSFWSFINPEALG